jgi:hypothetical protein
MAAEVTQSLSESSRRIQVTKTVLATRPSWKSIDSVPGAWMEGSRKPLMNRLSPGMAINVAISLREADVKGRPYPL